ncbi:TetR family transcriptional regulator [Spongiactinospora rosea]|uniref:TetR family transcriptional regulator n=1 Tax=Spongiactinospora rosea TaxID=2248750 RepID=A0A366LV74_9ACTN|nr:TetR family transcriptional regulator [Spongiactinospora rosea]RBQ17855.1 TetR family transcriptional regulator [Spongiactinospora rosea]
MSKLTREAVLDRAVSLADEEGIAAVSVRRLAAELDVTPMAMYWHFKNKEELFSAAADHLLAGLIGPPVPDQAWNDRLRAMVGRVIDLMRAHRSLPELLRHCDKNRALNFLRATDTVLGLLKNEGFSLTEGYYIASYLLNGCMGLVAGDPTCRPNIGEREAAEQRRQHRVALTALPPDAFPNVTEWGRTAPEPPDVEHYYAIGLDLLVAGVEGLAAARRT